MKILLKSIKSLNPYTLIYSLLLGAMVVLSRHVMFINSDRSTYENVYFTDVHLIDLLFILMLTFLIYLLLNAFKGLRKDMFFDKARDGKGIAEFIITFVVLIICYVPYMMSYWPGGVYSDTMNSIWIAMGTDPFTAHEPPLYTLLWKIMFLIGGGSLEPGDYGAIKLFTIVQSVGMAALFASFTNWNYRRGAKKSVITAMTLIFALFPLYGYYAVSLWKDTIFGIIIFLYSWFIYCMMERITASSYITTSKDGTVALDISVKDIVLYSVLSVLTAFGRNNGIYIMIVVNIIVLLANIKNRKVFKKLGITVASLIVGCLLIRGPLFTVLGYNVDTAVESMAIPLEQTGYIVCTDGALDDNDITVINNIMSIETWKEIYSPINVDYLKFDPSFDRDYFNANTGTFFKTYLHICMKNPVKALKGYLLATMGFWDVFNETGNAYVNPECIAWTGIFQGDFFEYNLGVSFRELVTPRHYIPSAIWAWIMLFALFMCAKNKSKAHKILPIIPSVCVWVTIMLAVPLAFSFRYIFAVFLCMPIYWLCLINDKEN